MGNGVTEWFNLNLLQIYWVHSQSNKSKTGQMYVCPMAPADSSVQQETAGSYTVVFQMFGGQPRLPVCNRV